MNKAESLSDMKTGEKAVIKRLLSNESIRRRLLDIGMIEGTTVECVGQSPCKDPCAYLVRGAVIAIRARDGRDILIERPGNGIWG